MDYPKFIASNQKEESFSIQRANLGTIGRKNNQDQMQSETNFILSVAERKLFNSLKVPSIWFIYKLRVRAQVLYIMLYGCTKELVPFGGFLFSGVYSIIMFVIHCTFMRSFVLAILAPQFLLIKQQVTVPTDTSHEIFLIKATDVCIDILDCLIK